MTDDSILTRFDFLAQSGELLRGPRQENYGDAIVNISRFAVMMSVVVNTQVTPIQAALTLVSLKLSRLASPTISLASAVDSIVDAIAYLAIAGEFLAVATPKSSEVNDGGG